MKILLVDDTELFLDLERSYLSRETFTFETARSGAEALACVAKDKPDLILLDLVMPGMDGDAVCRKLKADPATKKIPIVMLGSTATADVAARCQAAGCDAFVAKPIVRDQLLSTIERILVIAKRQHSRAPTHLAARVTMQEIARETFIHTISDGGLFIEWAGASRTGQTLNVEFSLPQSREPIRASAAVKWAGKVREGGAEGVGVEFLDIRAQDRSLIRDYVQAKLRMVGSLKGFA